MDCLFCKIINKELPSKVVYENETTLAFLDIYPNSEGHTLVIPKKHTPDFLSTDDAALQEVLKTKKIVAQILQEKLQPKGFNFISNNGAEAHQVVFHYHEHIVPKYEKTLGYQPSVNHNESDRDLENIHSILTK